MWSESKHIGPVASYNTTGFMKQLPQQEHLIRLLFRNHRYLGHVNSHSISKLTVFTKGEHYFAPLLQRNICEIRVIHLHQVCGKSPVCGGSSTGQDPHTKSYQGVPDISAQRQGCLLSAGDSCSFYCLHRQSNFALKLRYFLWFHVHLGSRFCVSQVSSLGG